MGWKLPRDLEADIVARGTIGPKANIPPPPDCEEKEFDRRVVDFAEANGWTSFHAYDCRRSAAGWPDRVFVRERVVYAELKSEKGRLTPEQVAWVARLLRAGAEVHVWKPADWAEVVKVLQ